MVILAICVFAVAVEHLGEGHAPSALHQLVGLICSKLVGLFNFGWAEV